MVMKIGQDVRNCISHARAHAVVRIRNVHLSHATTVRHRHSGPKAPVTTVRDFDAETYAGNIANRTQIRRELYVFARQTHQQAGLGESITTKYPVPGGRREGIGPRKAREGTMWRIGRKEDIE
jgi:hypothetical protein